MNSRCNLGLRRATASSNSLFSRQADGINGNASAFADTFTLETPLVPAGATHSSLFGSAHTRSAKFAPCFQSLVQSFSLFAKERNAISIPFNHFQTLCKSAGGVRPPPRQNTSVSPRRLGQRRVPTERRNTDQASELDLVAARYSPLCLCFVTSLLRPCTRRNLISRLIILWRRDTEPILVAWVYTPVSGFVFDALA